MGKHSKESKFFKNKKNISRKKRAMPLSQKCLLTVFILTFLICAIILLKWYLDTSRAENQYEELSKSVIESADEPEEKIGINFDKLNEINSDIVAWIKIDKTNIDYPIVQKNDNNYYLTKNFYNKKDRTGAIFLDYKNKKDFTDLNTVIYGHNIKRGTMFADLLDIYNGTMGKDIEINIYTPTKNMKYKVFSSYCNEPEKYGINTSITLNSYKEFKEQIIKKSKIDFEQSVEIQSRILTLSTCDRTGKKRVLVHAQLMN